MEQGFFKTYNFVAFVKMIIPFTNNCFKKVKFIYLLLIISKLFTVLQRMKYT